MNRKIVGGIGERVVSQLLINRGCKVLARNWFCRYGELDIVATVGKSVCDETAESPQSDTKAPGLISIEVKTRTGTVQGEGIESVSNLKYAHMVKSFDRWLRENRYCWDCVVGLFAIEVIVNPKIVDSFMNLADLSDIEFSKQITKLINSQTVIVNSVEIGV